MAYKKINIKIKSNSANRTLAGERPVTTFLAIGDVHGLWRRVIDAISEAAEVLGTSPDVVFQTGDAEPHRSEEDLAGCHGPKKYRRLGEFSYLAPGDIKSPVYFIGGNHEPYIALDATAGPYPTPWGNNLSVYYLGRSGAAAIGRGLNIAWLSGIYSPNADVNMREKSIRMRTYFSQKEVEHTIASANNLGDIDVLLTHDWPSGLRPGVGNDISLKLIQELHPSLHLCGHMHEGFSGYVGGTDVHALNIVPNNTEERYGWWRLYKLLGDGSIECLAIGL